MKEISQKINGAEDKASHGMSIKEQVQMLITEASDNTKLAQMFVGMCTSCFFFQMMMDS